MTLERRNRMTKAEALESFEKLLEEIDKDNWLFVGTINPQLIEMAIIRCLSFANWW